MIGRTIGHYTILEQLGAGGMGEVYRAEDLTLKRQVALKVLSSDLATSRERLERLQREAETLAALDHPNIVTVFTVEHDASVHFLTMQLVEGRRLSELIPEGGMPLERLLDIALPLADALAAAHAKGVTHRDLKPSNIMIANDGRVKVLDFGLAKLRADPASMATTTRSEAPLTGKGRILGTVPYMSPEQARGEDLDTRTDLFSLGVVLYEMATGTRPFTGSTDAVVFDEILHKAPISPARVNPAIPDDFGHVIDKALEKDRALRYQSADDLLTDLKRLGRDTTVARSPTSGSHPAVHPIGRGWVKVAAGVVVAGLILLALWASGIGRSRPSDTAAFPAGEELERSIAVLPFDNLSGDPDQAYFSDGLTIEMIAQLSKIASLDKVIAFASSSRYRDSEKSVADIGRELGAALLLDGTVRQQGERVRVTVQLIEAAGQGQLWAETYDGDLGDIFAVQRQIAERIAAALRVELPPRQKARIGQRPTSNLTAYGFYLKGQDFRVRYNKQANESAIDFFRAALELDPEFALARAGLAYACALQGYVYGGSSSWLDTAIDEAEQALAGDPSLADAHVALAAAYTIKGWTSRALEESNTAIALSPNGDRGFLELGWVHASAGRWDEASAQFGKALALNPLHAYNYWSMGLPHLALGNFERAEQWARKALELQPDDTMAQFVLWPAVWAQGRLEEANEISHRLLALSPEDPKSHLAAAYTLLVAGDLPRAGEHFRRAFELAPETLLGDFRIASSYAGFLWDTGQRAEAQRLFAQSLALDERELAAGNASSRPLTDIAFIHATRGDTVEALRRLQQAVEAGYVGIDHPAWRTVQAESEFRQMKSRVDARVVDMRRRIAEIEQDRGLDQVLASGPGVTAPPPGAPGPR